MPQDLPDAKDGLKRLGQAVASSTMIDHCPQQKPNSIMRMAAFCRLIRPLDMYSDIAARHPEWGRADQIQAKLWRLRRVIPGVPRRVCLSPYQLAQMYLASIPEFYRRQREP